MVKNDFEKKTQIIIILNLFYLNILDINIRIFMVFK
jgi:hypothetical protein